MFFFFFFKFVWNWWHTFVHKDITCIKLCCSWLLPCCKRNYKQNYINSCFNFIIAAMLQLQWHDFFPCKYDLCSNFVDHGHLGRAIHGPMLPVSGATFDELSGPLVHTESSENKAPSDLVHTDYPWSSYGPMAWERLGPLEDRKT